MTRRPNRLPLLIVAGAWLAGISGCVQHPAPEVVLKGTWELVPSAGWSPPVTNCFITFDSNDDLTQVSYKLAGNTTVTWDDPPTSVSVDGDAITISATQGGNSLVFNGTLDSTKAPTQATGTLNMNFAAGSVTLSVSQGSATLVKQ